MSTQSPRRLAVALALAAPLATLLPAGLTAQAPLAPVTSEADQPAAGVAPVAPKREGTPAPAVRRPARRERDQLTHDEISTTTHADLLSLIRAERPLWLSTRGRTSLALEDVVQVYYGGILLGGPEVLRRMNVGGVREIRHLNSREATMLYGKNHGVGAILLVPGT